MFFSKLILSFLLWFLVVFPPFILPFFLCLPSPSQPPFGLQIAREAEAAIYHRPLFESLLRCSSCTDTADAMAVGAVEASYKCLSPALIVLTESGR